MGFDRSKFKTTSNKDLQKQDAELKEKRPDRGSSQFADYHKIEDGVNRFRLFPFHPEGGGKTYAVPRCTSWLEINRPKRNEEGKVIEGQFELKRFPLFNAKVHGGLTHDPVEAYMDIAKETAIPALCGDDQDRAKIVWNSIVGYRDAKGYHDGIKPTDVFVCYAAKEQKDGSWKLGLLELKKTIKDKLVEIALEVTNGESPDPYTSVEDGYVIKIVKSGSGLETKYTTSIDSQLVSKTQSNLIVLPITDLQLEEFMKFDSLQKKFVNSYKRSDFDTQVEGLKRFDDNLRKNKMPIDVFGIDEFLDTLENISSQIKEEEPKDSEEDLPFEPGVIESKPVPKVIKSTPKKTVPVAAAEETIEDEAPREQNAAVGSDRIAALKKKYGK